MKTSKYFKTISLKDGRECILRNGAENDGANVLKNFILTHRQTDFLLSYPDENTMTADGEAKYLKEKTDSKNEIEIVAVIDGKIIGTAGIDRIGSNYKVNKRAEFGVSIDKNYWGRGIGRALTQACIECAKIAGYAQLELSVVADNKNAIALYKSEGFVEYGRNPKGFRSRTNGWQELILMRLELK